MEAQELTLFRIIYPLILGASIFHITYFISVYKSKLHVGNIAILVLLLTFNIPLWNHYAYHVIGDIFWILSWPFDNTYWLTGPLLLIFCKASIHPGVNYKLDWLHLVPFIAHSVYTKFFPISNHTQWSITIALWNLMMLGYLLYLGYYVIKLHRASKHFFASNFLLHYRWTLLLVLGFASFLFTDMYLGTLIILNISTPDLSLNTFKLIRASYVVLLVIVLNKTDFIFAFRLSLDQADEIPQKKPTRLLESTAQTIVLELNQLVKNEEVFRQPDISLRSLSEKLGITSHELSELLNTFMNTNFYDYINGQRIKYAAQKLEETEQPIVNIAISAGFNSKTAFYSAFKKLKNTTPSQYRKNFISLNTN